VAADTWEWFPFTMLMVPAALQMIPGEPIVAPRIDGAGRLALFRYILFPYIRRCRPRSRHLANSQGPDLA
jgi:multiple sugar transport system permease protein